MIIIYYVLQNWMGKEISGIIRPLPKKQMQRRNGQLADPQKELAFQWDPRKEATSSTQLAENGGVVVTIRTKNSEKVVTCTGFSRRGNKYAQLVGMLRRRGLIPIRARINSFLLDKGFVDIKADPDKECFLAGDRLILLLSGASHQVRKVIREQQKASFSGMDIPQGRKVIKKINKS